MSDHIPIPRCPANWNMQLVCSCKKQHQLRRAYPAIAKRLSPYGTSALSNHNVCSNQNVLLQLEVPPVHNGDDSRIVEIVGRTVYTVLEGDHFLTEVEFLRFENGAQATLMQALAQHFGKRSA